MKRIYYYFCNKIKKMSDTLRQLVEHATSQGYKANVLKPLIGMEVVLLFATISLFKLDIFVFGYIVGALCVIILICFIYCYFYCLFKDPNLLRSERYNLEKTAIDKISIQGDSSFKSHIAIPDTRYVVIESMNNEVNQLQKDK